MRRSIAAAAALGLVSATAHGAGARQPLVLEPTSDWVLDYADQRCTLIRAFGEGRDEVRLRIDSFGSWTGFRFTVIGRPLPVSHRPTGELKVRFTPDGEDRNTGSLRGTSDGVEAAAFRASIMPIANEAPADPDRSIEDWLADPAVLDFETRTNSLLLMFDGRTQILLRLGAMRAPLRAMRACVDDLYSSWGFDPAAQRSLRQGARPTEQTVRAMQQRYPQAMGARGMSAYVPVRVRVDAHGQPSDCLVQSDVVDEVFARAVCAGLSRPFEPALDRDGSPVDSMYQTAVIYLVGG